MCDVYDYCEIYFSWGNVSTKDEEYLKKEQLFKDIERKVVSKTDDIDMSTMKTNNGETQKPERVSIRIIKDILDDMGLIYECAGSQQSKDFRNVRRPGSNVLINIEIKKTDNTIVYFNDTCPSIDIFYIIMFTGKEFKTKQNMPPKIIFINGYELLKDDEGLINMYKCVMENIKNEWGRKKNGGYAKKFKRMSVYPRPTYKADISDLLSQLISPSTII